MSKKQDEGKSHVYIENPACKPHKAFVIGAINDVVKQQVAEPYCRKRDDERPLFVCKISGPKKNEGSHRSKDRKSTRLNSSHVASSYAVFCLKKKNKG